MGPSSTDVAIASSQQTKTHYDDNELISLIQFHSIDIIVGAVSSVVCALTLLVFISSKEFLIQNKLLTQLAVADLCTSVGILALGLMRKSLYTEVMETSRVPIETSWTCAGKPFVYLRLLGALVPPCIVLWISVERFLAVFAAKLFRHFIRAYADFPPVFVLIYTTVSVAVAYYLAWHNRNRGPVEAYCGRKVAFTKAYTTYVYLADIGGFVIALLINCVTLCWLGRLYTERQNRFEVKKQIRRINYLLVISIISTLTVAIPNGISLASAWFGRLNIALSDPANWMIAVKCSANLFVYLLLKAEFRQRVYEILGCLSVDENKDLQNINANMRRQVTEGNRDRIPPLQSSRKESGGIPPNLSRVVKQQQKDGGNAGGQMRGSGDSFRKAWTTGCAQQQIRD